MNFFKRRARQTTPVSSADQAGPRLDEVEEHLVSLLAPSSFPAERYRMLRHIVEQAHKDADLRLVAVTSPAVGDGKTTTAINLAGTLAQAPDARVLLVDADLRRGAVRDQLGLRDTELGFVDLILNAKLTPGEVVHRCPDFNLFVLPAGHCPAAPYEALKSPRFGELLREIRGQYDYVVLDTPPVLPVPDSRVIAKWVDGLLMIVAAHKTPRRLVEEALDVMDPGKMLGLVFNRHDHRLSGYSSYYGTYGSYGANASGQSPDGNRAGRWRWTVRRAANPARKSS